MPLPTISEHGAQQCHARSKRSGNQCLNPAAYGLSVCRMHGARPPQTILRGSEHPSYKHGRETLEAKAERSAKLVELRDLESLMHALKMTSARRMPGRKPKAT